MLVPAPSVFVKLWLYPCLDSYSVQLELNNGPRAVLRAVQGSPRYYKTIMWHSFKTPKFPCTNNGLSYSFRVVFSPGEIPVKWTLEGDKRGEYRSVMKQWSIIYTNLRLIWCFLSRFCGESSRNARWAVLCFDDRFRAYYAECCFSTRGSTVKTPKQWLIYPRCWIFSISYLDWHDVSPLQILPKRLDWEGNLHEQTFEELVNNTFQPFCHCFSS